MHVEIAYHSHYGGHTSPNAIYNPVTLTWQPDQIVTWQPDKRTRKLGRRRDFIYWGKSEKKKIPFLTLASLELNTFFGGRQWWNDGRYSTFLFLEFSCCIFWPDVFWIWKYVTCRESNDIEPGRKRPRRKKNYVQDTTVGEKITSNYAKIFQTMSAFVLMLYNDVTSTTQLRRAGNMILIAEKNEF